MGERSRGADGGVGDWRNDMSAVGWAGGNLVGRAAIVEGNGRVRGKDGGALFVSGVEGINFDGRGALFLDGGALFVSGSEGLCLI